MNLAVQVFVSYWLIRGVAEVSMIIKSLHKSFLTNFLHRKVPENYFW
jgi:hypothetical protein